MTAEIPQLDLNASILKHVKMIKPWIPERAIIAIGEYASETLKNFDPRNNDTQILFVGKTKKAAPSAKPAASKTIGLGAKVNTHYWYTVQQNLETAAFGEKLGGRISEKLSSALVVASTSEGAGSFLLPETSLQLKARNIDSVAFAILPSKVQPPDAFFNSLWSMSACASQDVVQVLIDRDGFEEYVGVDRNGSVLKGNDVLNYLLNLVLSKESFVQEVNDLSKSYNVKAFTALAATGASFQIHGSFENVLAAASLEPFSSFDIASATVLYALVRMPSRLRGKLTASDIELTINKWFRDRANLKAVRVAEPVYVDDGNDRLDVLMLVGGFDLGETAAAIDKKVKDIVSYAAKKEFIKEKEWQEIVGKLLG